MTQRTGWLEGTGDTERCCVFVSLIWLFYSYIRFTQEENTQLGLCSDSFVQKEDFLLEGFFLLRVELITAVVLISV